MIDPLKRFRLDGQVAVVTGGASGLGRAAAIGLAAIGATVAVVDRDAHGAAAAATEIREAGGRADAFRADVSDAAEVEAAFAAIVAAHGRIDVLVNSAGIAVRVPATEISLEDWERVVGVNLTGVFLCCRTAARTMIAQQSGRIVTMASIMGLSGGLYPNASYQATKGAVVNLTRALALEWAASGIRVNAVAPTFVETELTRGLLADPARRAEIERATPLGRLASLDDITHAVLYLASDASAMVTGHTLPVDGGFLAR